MLHSVGVIGACLRAVVLRIMDRLLYLVLLIHYSDREFNDALLSLSTKDAKFRLEGLNSVGSTLSGDSSALKHFLPVLEVS